jgi:transketolase/transaldolase
VSTHPELEWTATDERAVDLIRVLAMDSVQKVGNGHPGTAMSLAPAAYLLFQRLLRHDPADPHWPGRDRFVLSCGHSSLTLYIQLYLSGYGLTLDDLKAYRTWGSITPGHPEHGLTPGVETTTGPLGQGIGNAVGMAMAARRERGLYDPDAEPGRSPFDHHVYAFMSDGDIEEGISHEVSSLAGHQRLGNLVVLYDNNYISIEDDTHIAKSEDVAARYEAYGWHVQRLSWRTPNGYHEDVEALYQALLTATENTEAPSLIALSTIIGWPAPHKQNTGAAHGSALGADEVAATKEILGFDPGVDFPVEDDALSRARQVAERGKRLHAEWEQSFVAWSDVNPDRRALFDRLSARRLPDGWTRVLPSFPADRKGMATRKASGTVLGALAPVLPELWGGSADLAESNLTTMEGEPSFIPVDHQTEMWPGNPYGRTMHFGIREHGMGAILNGIAVHGGTRPYGGTFLVFSDYMRGSVRLTALMELPVTYVWTHDSIGLGEDGPTHQPVEHLWALRAIPHLEVVRPGDANETVVAWRTALERARPTALCLTRQALPVFDRSSGGPGLASAEGVARGAYVLADGGDVILIGTGSEVAIALEARDLLAADGVAARVVSMPCVEWFNDQDESYRNEVLPPAVRARVSVEAGITGPWRLFVGDAGASIGVDHFGASAAYQKIYQEFGITAERVAAAARDSLARVRALSAEKAPALGTQGRERTVSVDVLGQLSEAGVSVWLDDISRDRLRTGNLQELIDDYHVVGVTSNPTIFAHALDHGTAYDAQLEDLKTRGVSVEEASRMITTYDIRWGCDVLRPQYDATDGQDGRVSLEVDPRLARKTAATIAEARALWWMVNRPNLLIKIPATREGLPAITQAISEAISVNVTLIFSLQRYGEVIDAYMAGLEKAAAAGHDLSTIRSVASFFVSRMDTEVDARLDKLSTPEATALRGKTAIANARLAYELFEQRFDRSSARWAALHDQGARIQRPLWASTSTKDPAFPDTMYVVDLAVADTVNTMPEGTIKATADHGQLRGDTVHGTYDASREILADMEKLGISYDDVVQVLEEEGVAKFEASWNELLETIKNNLGR